MHVDAHNIPARQSARQQNSGGGFEMILDHESQKLLYKKIHIFTMAQSLAGFLPCKEAEDMHTNGLLSDTQLWH